VCTGLTGHAEVVQVAYDPTVISDADVLRTFFESHDPTQGFRQGNDRGTQYRSTVYPTTPEQELAAREVLTAYQERLTRAGYGEITTEVRPAAEAGTYYYAEDYHQQYLDKNPNGYCGLGGTGVSCPRPLDA
jgi:peptide-methionine (S)-S-oxide reductase